MSKRQIRVSASEVRERIRYGIDTVKIQIPSVENSSWFRDAIDLCRELEAYAITEIQTLEKEIQILREENRRLRRSIE